MKKLFLFVILFSSLSIFAEDCDITVTAPSGLPACPGDLIQLSVFDSDTITYKWMPGGDTTAKIFVSPQSTTTYTVELSGEQGYYCSSLVVIDVYDAIEVEFNQIEITCPEISSAKVIAIASGSFPSNEYEYIWEALVNPIDSTEAVGLSSGRLYFITITDPNGCSLDTSFQPKAFHLPKVELFANPEDTVYLEKPFVDFSYTNLSIDTLGITNQIWDFGDESNTSNQASPTHRYTKASDSIFVKLTITDDHACDTIYKMPYIVKPIELFLPNAFTPNGDGINDYLVFTAKDGDRVQPKDLNFYYLSNELVVLNRNGRKVFSANNYENDWDGDKLPEGVYYFILTCVGEFSTDTFKGSIMILK
jgi:PKD repeat protein